MSIQEKLFDIQLNLKAPKNQYNSFGKYNYRNCEDIQEALKPLLKKNKVALILSDKIIQVGDRYYVEATAKLIDCETSAEISITACAREDDNKKGMDSSQLTGATSSYARKYAMNGMFCIDDSKDSDFLIGKNELKYLNEEIGRTGIGMRRILATYHVDNHEQLTKDNYYDAIGKLKKLPDKPSPTPKEAKTADPDNIHDDLPFG